MNDDLTVQDVTLLDGRRVDIAIRSGVIAGVEPTTGFGKANALNGAGRLCLRPITDAHLHLDKAGTASSLEPVPSSIHESIRAMGEIKIQAQHDKGGLKDRMQSMLGNVEAMGSRCLRIVVDVDDTWGLTSFLVAKELQRDWEGRLDLRIIAFPQEGLTSSVAELLREAAKLGANGIGAHTDVDADVPSHLRTAAEIARTAGVPLEVHVDEAASPNSFHLPEVLNIAGDIQGLTLVHCLSLATLEESKQRYWARKIQEVGAVVVVAPSVLSFGLPLAPMKHFLEADVPVLLGSDNLQDVFVPFGTGNMFETMRIAALVGRLGTAELKRKLLSGITDMAYGTIFCNSDSFQVGTPASFSVYEAFTPMDLFAANPTVWASIWNGEIIKRTT